MKAKKIIAIGLVATMTLGMSTSVFANDPEPVILEGYEDYANEPEFVNWDSEYGPYDNAYHVKGQGWLESGVGINESYANVIVPTTPNLNIKRGEPGLFDFGFDPQRLVKRTEAKKYATLENITQDALKNGIYFINDTAKYTSDDFGKDPVESLNTFDNKSVKYEAINIGTEDLALTVQATLKGGEKFAYLEEDPAAQDAPTLSDKKATDVLTEYKSVDAVTNAWNSRRNALNEDKQEGEEGYVSDDIWTFATHFVRDNDFAETLNGIAQTATFKTKQFKTESTGNAVVATDLVQAALIAAENAYEAAETAKYEAGVTAFRNHLDTYYLVNDESDEASYSDEVGMYMGLNVALGEEQTDASEEEQYSNPTEIPFKVVTDAASEGDEADASSANADAAAAFTQVVAGNPNNYKTIWDAGAKAYRYAMKEDRDEPFQTVAFWFRGVASYNQTVPADLKVPALDFTWSFSKEIPEPEVIAPKLAKVDGVDVSPEFAAEPVFGVNQYGETGVTLTFDPGTTTEGIKDITFSSNGNSYYPYANPDQYFTINGNVLEVKSKVFDIVTSDAAHIRYWKVSFGDNASVILVFVPEVN